MENITLTFNGLTAAEAAALISVLRPHPGAAIADAAPASVPTTVETVVDAAVERTADDVKTKKRGHKPKAAPNASIDDLRKALSDLLAAKGMMECSQLLAEFGATRIGEVPQDKYAAVVTACQVRQA